MNHFLNWIDMGGYWIYVWPAYGVVCVIFVMHLLGIKWQRLHTRKKILAWLKGAENK